LSCRKSDLEDKGHREEVDQKVGDDVQVGVGPPDLLSVTVGFARKLEFKIPEGAEGHACGADHDHDEGVVDHDASEEDVCCAPGPWKIPNADVEKHNGDLGAAKAKSVEENAVPSCLGWVNTTLDGR
jgi:hypothetical protein